MEEAHPLVERAARGELPPWAEASPSRKEHMARVGELLDGWAGALGLPAGERVRWAAGAWLHDALRDADPEALRGRVPPGAAALPGLCLHGPAAAERLRVDGVRDGELLAAIAWHTLGHPDLGTMGRALYAADFLEPGRNLLNEWRAELRARAPLDLTGVVREILGARIAYLVDRGSILRPETVSFWNVLATDE